MLEQHEGGCHCGRVRFRARVDLDLLLQCNCSIRTKKGILHLPVVVEDFELLYGKNALTVYTFGNRGGAAHLLLALRHARLLYPAFAAGPDHG
jgi:hypothetical protein